MRISRRIFLRHASVAALATGPLSAIGSAPPPSCQRVSGAGSYTLGPFDPLKDGDDPVFLVTDLGFDETMVFCTIRTNAPMLFQTAKQGLFELGANEFFMDMQSIRIASVTIQDGADGPHAVFAGTLRSETRLPLLGGKPQTIVEEEVLFGCDVTEFGPEANIEASKTNFSMTAHFDPRKQHAAIFGQEPTFAGRLTRGNIVIIA
jgi:hypothetical protein